MPCRPRARSMRDAISHTASARVKPCRIKGIERSRTPVAEKSALATRWRAVWVRCLAARATLKPPAPRPRKTLFGRRCGERGHCPRCIRSRLQPTVAPLPAPAKLSPSPRSCACCNPCRGSTDCPRSHNRQPPRRDSANSRFTLSCRPGCSPAQWRALFADKSRSGINWSSWS